jgi:hypothetical protein
MTVTEVLRRYAITSYKRLKEEWFKMLDDRVQPETTLS